jgi:hypothetical protein
MAAIPRANRRVRIFLLLCLTLAASAATWFGCCRKPPDAVQPLSARGRKQFKNNLELPGPLVESLIARYPDIDVVQTQVRYVNPADPSNRYVIIIDSAGRRLAVVAQSTGQIIRETEALPARALPASVRSAFFSTVSKENLSNPTLWTVVIERDVGPESSEERFVGVFVSDTARVSVCAVASPNAGVPDPTVVKIESERVVDKSWPEVPVSKLDGQPMNAIKALSPSIRVIGAQHRYKDGVDQYDVQALDNGVPIEILVYGDGRVMAVTDERKLLIQ